MTLTPSAADTELLELGQLVLKEAGYTAALASINGLPYLLAEDRDNVVVLAAVLGIDDIFAIEPALSRVLVDRLAGGTSDSKKWDGYVVVLTGRRPDDATTDALFSLTYNLRQVRRLIRVGVEATNAGVARSLQPVLPLRQVAGEAALGDPLAALEHRIIADGLDEKEVARAISTFRTQANVLDSPGIRDSNTTVADGDSDRDLDDA